MRRAVLVLFMLVLVLPVRNAALATDPAVSDGTGPLDTPADLAAAERFEALIPEHTFYGMVVPLGFDKWPHLDPTAQPWRMEGEGDSGNYTGNYLAAQSWRYSQAKAELSELGLDPLSTEGGAEAGAFWRQQRDEAKARGTQMVDYFHILVNIAKNWQTAFDPKIDNSKNPDEFGWFDFGGGLIPGEAGLLMRTCTPEDADPPYSDLRQNFTGHPELIGPFAWDDGRDWYCVGSTSRDSYMGTLFGLGVALDFLATDENPGLRATLAHDLMALTDYAVKYLWFQPRPHGRVANPVFGHNDLTGPISPLFIQVPIARLHLLQNARHAAAVTGDAAASQRYEVLWAEEVANTVGTGSLLAGMVIDAGEPHDAYYKYHLHLMSYFNVIRLEPDPIIREEFKRAMAVLDKTITDDGNAFFEAMTYALTGETQRLDEAVGLHRQWLNYYAFHEETARRGVTPFVHTGRCDITEDPGPGAPIEEQPLECRPKEQVDMITTLPTGDEVMTPYQPDTTGERRAKDPLPVGVRRLADFLWQKDPTIIGGDHNTPWRGPSVDFLVTYWMLRYYSEVEVPAVAPLPAFAGPRFV
jgi:hypothetical protein